MLEKVKIGDRVVTRYYHHREGVIVAVASSTRGSTFDMVKIKTKWSSLWVEADDICIIQA